MWLQGPAGCPFDRIRRGWFEARWPESAGRGRQESSRGCRPEAGERLPAAWSAAGMMLRMQFLHAFAGDVRVDLRGREVGMTEQHLHDSKVRTVIEQVRREGMTERVRREILVDPGLARVAFDDVPEGLAGHLVAAARREKKIGLALEQDFGAWPGYKLLQPAYGFLTERNEPLAIALADDAQHALIEIDLVVAQVHELGDPEPGRVQHFEHRAIAVTERIGHERRVEERFNLALRERLRQRSADLGHGDLGGRIF